MFLDSKTDYFSEMAYAFKTNAHIVKEETATIDGKTATLLYLSPGERQTEANQVMAQLNEGNKTFTFFFEKPTLAYQRSFLKIYDSSNKSSLLSNSCGNATLNFSLQVFYTLLYPQASPAERDLAPPS